MISFSKWFVNKTPRGLFVSVHRQRSKALHLKALEIIKNRWKKTFSYQLEVLVKRVGKNFTNRWKKIATRWNFLRTRWKRWIRRWSRWKTRWLAVGFYPFNGKPLVNVFAWEVTYQLKIRIHFWQRAKQKCKEFVKYLGILIDRNLSRKHHVKVSRVRYFVPTHTLLTIYRSWI